MKLERPVANHGLRLRSVEPDDAQFILSLRLDPEAARFIGETSPDPEEQRRWIIDQQQRENDFYCIIESGSAMPLGTVALYNISSGGGEWGRWLLKRGTLAAVGSAVLLYQLAFDQLSLVTLFCRTVLANAQVVSFHDSCGLRRIRLEPGGTKIRGVMHDIIVHELNRGNWDDLRPRLEDWAKQAARFLPP